MPCWYVDDLFAKMYQTYVPLKIVKVDCVLGVITQNVLFVIFENVIDVQSNVIAAMIMFVKIAGKSTITDGYVNIAMNKNENFILIVRVFPRHAFASSVGSAS